MTMSYELPDLICGYKHEMEFIYRQNGRIHVSKTNLHELDEILSVFEDFLRGCGFRIDGELIENLPSTDE